MNELPVEALIEEALSSLSDALAGRRVVVRIAADAGEVLADAQTGIAVRDLVVAASEAAPPGGELSLAAVRWESSVEMRVGGAGPEILSGTCAGLARAKAAVTPGGGDAWVEEAPGGGATLALRLPAS